MCFHLKDKCFTGQKKIVVYCQNKAEHINKLGGQNAELLVLNLAVHAQPLGCKGLPNVQQTISYVRN